ncbi:MAG: hypothetical protein Ct9H300mP8_01770 [Gammaproteobacteria bacterium]|nr:MAG: hypothetical protein Ct9H300mP8_01770 [Gammaproteobacteria bacterium]
MKRDQRTITVSEIHDTPQRGVFYVTGGGSLFVSDLLTVPRSFKYGSGGPSALRIRST